MVKKRYYLKIEDCILLLLPLAFVILLIIPHKTVKEEPKKEQEKIILGPDITIKVYNPSKSVIEAYDLDEYLVGVVGAEMPPDFDDEALKAQAVAARTYALGRMKGLYGSALAHFGADVCTDSTHCQAWISKERFLEVYGDEQDWEKIKEAVYATKGIVITYENTLINPLFHSNSGGVTEDVEEVWAVSGSVPYLKSVYSPDESDYPDYEKKVVLTWDNIKQKIKKEYPKATFEKSIKDGMEIKEYSASGRVLTLRIGSVTVPGTEFRTLFGLRSTNFGLNFASDTSVEIETIGFGHGVGMSQCGADALAKEGYTYQDILEYYYTGVQVGEIGQ